MATHIRVNVSDALIAQAKRQVEAARFRRTEQQQLTAAGATIAAAVAQNRQSPADPRSFWQVQRKRQVIAEEPIAARRREIAFVMFSLRGQWGRIEQSSLTVIPPEIKITVTAPNRNYVSDSIDIEIYVQDISFPWKYVNQFFISSMKRSYTVKNGYARVIYTSGDTINEKYTKERYYTISDAELRTIMQVTNQSYNEFSAADKALLSFVSRTFPDQLAAIPIFANGSVSQFKIESKNLIPLNPDNKIFLAWGKLGQYTNAVVLPSSLPDVYTYTMTWLKQP